MPHVPARLALIAVLGTLALILVPVARPALAAAPGHTPDLVKGVAYLTSPGNLIEGDYYESYPGTADFGLTMDGAFALAATGKDVAALRKITGFIASDGKDQSGRTVDGWTGIGTKSAAGGSIAKEALLAEVVGGNPGNFGGHNLIAALDASVCVQASPGTGGPCAGAGNYRYATSVFDQAIGVIAAVRAGRLASAKAPITFLQGLRNPDGSFPSLIPDSHDEDVDSTAMAVMALALVKSQAARADVARGIAWIAGQQRRSGGFRGTGGVSVNSTGLAIQALSLRAARYRPQIRAALAFLASQQNANGGFDAYAGGSRSSDVRASTQAVSGATGISFGTLTWHLNSPAAASKPRQSRPWILVGALVIVLATMVAGSGVLLRRRQAVPEGTGQ